jgi:hypothetical protein
MASIQLKMIDEGLKADQHSFVDQLRLSLSDHDIYIADNADLSLKVKFVIDDGHEKVLLILRDSDTKQKIEEDVLLYFPDKWISKAVKQSTEMVVKALEGVVV